LNRQADQDKSESLGEFDLIFADPPYEKMESGEFYTDKLLNHPALPRLIAPDGIFILEKRPGETVPDSPLWQIIRRKTYGATEVLFLGVNPQSAIRTPQSV
jgi:16S rRNA (guanine966-N2)-methyltransferase